MTGQDEEGTASQFFARRVFVSAVRAAETAALRKIVGAMELTTCVASGAFTKALAATAWSYRLACPHAYLALRQALRGVRRSPELPPGRVQALLESAFALL